MKKIYIFIFISVLINQSLATKINYNSNLAILINNGKWIESKEYLNCYRDSINEFMLLVGESMINSFTNNPELAIKSINCLIEKYGNQLGNQVVQFYGLLLNNYDELQQYDKSIEICDRLIQLEGLPLNIVEGTLQRKKWCKKLSSLPKFEVIQTNNSSSYINYSKSKLTSSIIFEVQSNGKKVNAILDTGSSVISLNKEQAKRLDVKYFFDDTIKLNRNKINARMGIIDSMKFANYIFYNIPVRVIVDSLNLDYSGKKTICDSLEKAKKSLKEFDIILGMSLLKHIKELHIDTDNKILNFPIQESIPDVKNDMQLVNNLLYLQITINGLKYVGLLDTGLNIDLLINNSFYQKHSKNFEIKDAKVTTKILRYNEIEELTGKSLIELNIEIGNIIKQLANVLIVSETKNGYDGIIGDFILRDYKNVIFNFNNMWFTIY